MDHSAEIAQYILWSGVALGVWAVVFLVLCIGVLYAVYRLTTVLKRIEAALDPLACKGLAVMVNVDQAVTALRGKAETIIDTGEKALEGVAAKVDTTSSLIEGAVARPAIRISSLLNGINRGLETWRQFTPTRHPNGSAAAASEHKPAVVPVDEL